MTLRFAEYVDAEGRSWMRMIPEDSPDSEAAVGIPVGPPPLDGLSLPLKIEVALHNQLFARKIFSEKDARKNLDGIRASLMAALQFDVNRILAIYQGQGALNGQA